MTASLAWKSATVAEKRLPSAREGESRESQIQNPIWPSGTQRRERVSHTKVPETQAWLARGIADVLSPMELIATTQGWPDRPLVQPYLQKGPRWSAGGQRGSEPAHSAPLLPAAKCWSRRKGRGRVTGGGHRTPEAALHGKEFHRLTPRWVKKYFLGSVLTLPTCNLHGCPLGPGMA